MNHVTARVPRGIVAVRADAEGAPNIKALIEEMNKAFATFREEHGKQLEEVKKGTHDAIQALKVDKINADVSRLQTAIDEANIALAARGTVGNDDVKDAEYTKAFSAFVRKGEVQASLSKGSDADGGYTAPTEWDRTITDALKIVSPMRQICRVQSISVNSFSKLFNKRGTASGWVGETDARPATAGSQFGSLAYNTCELYANPAATQTILDDSLIDLAGWIAGEVNTEFAYQEGKAFISGVGTNKQPDGLLTYATGGVNAAKHPFGAVGVVNSGAAAAITADGVLNLIYSLPSAFVGNASILCNRKTLGLLRLLKDSQNRYLWQPSYAAGQPSTLAGFPVVEVNDMPDVAAAALAVAFGDFQQGYLIVDRVGIRMLRDPFTNKPYVSFYTTKRVGGGVLNPEAMKVMAIAA